MKLNFFKYQGTGNDFVMVDNRGGLFSDKSLTTISNICDRRFGIGADGFILLEEKNGSHYMQYFNSDGRESSMCGNGGRCFTLFIKDLGLMDSSTEFGAIDGLHEATLSAKEAQSGEYEIALKMVDVASIKLLKEGVYELNTGSPHYVKFQEQAVAETELIKVAKDIRYNEPYTEKGINVNLVNFINLKELEIRTYERGVEDETLSCGTGATATALAAASYSSLPAGVHQINVKVAGGQLAIKFNYNPSNNSFTDIWLMGPAKRVFKGEIDL